MIFKHTLKILNTRTNIHIDKKLFDQEANDKMDYKNDDE